MNPEKAFKHIAPNRELKLPEAPPWRDFPKRCELEPVDTLPRTTKKADEEMKRIAKHHSLRTPPEGMAIPREVEVIRAALTLRRPILITGDPGSGKSSLAYVASYWLNLGPVLRWNINSKSTRQEGLYQYDAIGRLQHYTLVKHLREAGKEAEASAEEDAVGKDPYGPYFRLGPLGTALIPRKTPRVLLIDEIDKSDLDLPNDLLHILEEGRFEIPELTRRKTPDPVRVRTFDVEEEFYDIVNGVIQCYEFPLIFLSSNAEREFSSAFLRRCLLLELKPPTEEELEAIIRRHMEGSHMEGSHMEGRSEIKESDTAKMKELARKMVEGNINELRTTDQLLNTFFAEAYNDFDGMIRENSFHDVS